MSNEEEIENSNNPEHQQPDISEIIKDSFTVDEEGIQNVTRIDLNKLPELGIKDVSQFMNGYMDSVNEEDFNDSSVDYIKGYKYGKTGKF